MATFDVYNQSREKVAEIELSDEIFDTQVKEHLFWEVVRNQLASRRAGTASTKTRSTVQGSGRKPFRQKGTGRARQGTTRSPHYVGGSVAHGPSPRDYSYTVPKKVRRQALRSALSLHAQNNQLTIIEDLELSEIKSRQLIELFNRFDVKKALVIDDEGNKNLELSCRNLADFQVLPTTGLNVYDLLRFEHIVVTKSAIKAIEERLLREIRR